MIAKKNKWDKWGGISGRVEKKAIRLFSERRGVKGEYIFKTMSS